MMKTTSGRLRRALVIMGIVMCPVEKDLHADYVAPYQGDVISVKLAPDGNIAAIVGEFGLAFYSLPDLTVLSVSTDVVSGKVSAFSEDSAYFAVKRADGRIQVWDLDGKRHSSLIKGRLHDSTQAVTGIAFEPSPNSPVTALVLGDAGGDVSRVGIQSGKCFQKLRACKFSVKNLFKVDENHLLVSCGRGEVASLSWEWGNGYSKDLSFASGNNEILGMLVSEFDIVAKSLKRTGKANRTDSQRVPLLAVISTAGGVKFYDIKKTGPGHRSKAVVKLRHADKVSPDILSIYIRGNPTIIAALSHKKITYYSFEERTEYIQLKQISDTETRGFLEGVASAARNSALAQKGLMESRLLPQLRKLGEETLPENLVSLDISADARYVLLADTQGKLWRKKSAVLLELYEKYLKLAEGAYTEQNYPLADAFYEKAYKIYPKTEDENKAQ